MRLPFPRRASGDDDPRGLHRRYNTAHAAGDAVLARHLLEQFLAVAPDKAWAWFDLGLFHKRAREWIAAEQVNERALALESSPGDPAAWNLGIAATALGHWETARRAWATYGVGLVENGVSANDPIELDLGLTPVRLNPEPRHVGDSPLLIDGRQHETEVVWCERLCPARARITNVPLPASGHRFGDVILHDGEPVGERLLRGQARSVFNELEVMVRSPLVTSTVDVVATDADAETLQTLFLDRDWGAEEWASSVRMLCAACSEGSPNASAHAHAPNEQPARQTWRTIAVAAPPADARGLIDAWLSEGKGREAGPLTPA